VRRGRKAAGLFGKMAELPKDKSKVVRLFFLKGFFKKYEMGTTENALYVASRGGSNSKEAIYFTRFGFY